MARYDRTSFPPGFRRVSFYMSHSRFVATMTTSFTSSPLDAYIQQKGGPMRRSGLNLSDEERAAIEAMTDADMKDAAKDDPDARELTAEMLAHHAPNARLEKSKAKRQAAARALVEQARDEAAATHEREREHIGK